MSISNEQPGTKTWASRRVDHQKTKEEDLLGPWRERVELLADLLHFQPAAVFKNLILQPFNESMLVVHVHVHVKPASVEAFKQASLANARESIKEQGIASFDVVQQQDDPTRFVLVEAYRTPEAPAAHKETKHYASWRDAVAPMMAEPRSSVKYQNLFPDDAGW